MKRGFVFLTLLLSFFVGNVFTMSLPRRLVFVSIDSLTDNHLSQTVIIEPINDSINITIKGKTLSFQRLNRRESFLSTIYTTHKQDSTFYLQTSKLLSFTADSIYFSAKIGFDYTKLDQVIEDTISINRDQLKGISYFEVAILKNKMISFYGGIGINIKDKEKEKEKNNKNYYIAELGYSYSKIDGVIGYTLYSGSEFLFNKDRFLVGPKVGAGVSIILAMLGTELISYTDFKHQTLYCKPYFAIGFHSFKCSIGYNIPLYSKELFNLSSATISLTIPFGIKEKKY